MRVRKLKKLASTKHLVALEGWTEAEQIDSLKSDIQAQFGDGVFIQELDVVEDDWENVPIKLKNHPLIEPFELVTEMYALPKYYEKDPTPILMPFYFTFFGMMVVDLGYGLFLFLATFLALKLFNLPKGTRRFLKFFNMLAVAVSLWGIVYGSFFGYTMPIVLLSTTTDVMTILLLSVAFGFVTVVVGLLLGGLQKLRLKDYAESYNFGFAWCLILIGILLIVLGAMLPHLSVMTTIGSVLAIANAIGIVIVSIIQAKSLVGLGSGFYNLYNISGYVGNLVSFTRLMALGLSGASISSAFNLIIEIFPPVVRFTIGIVIFILLHAINIFLSLLSGYMHGARLMFVEFFGKFYEGGGKPFRPLVEEMFSVPTKEVQLFIETENVMSVTVPKMHSHIENPYGDDNGDVVYSYLASNSEMDDTLVAIEGLTEELLRLAEIEKSCQLMADEIEKTRRRVNGLEYSTIPQLEETIHYIELKLEETERANLVRIMKVK